MSTPLVVQLKNRPCAVIGGGKVAQRKIRHLLAQQAAVTVISPDLTDGLKKDAGNFRYYPDSVVEADVLQRTCKRLNLDWSRFFLLVAATDSPSLNETAARHLSQYIPLINVVDNQELSSFFFPSVLARGRLKIAVTTSGASPILASKIRAHLSGTFGPEYGPYVDYLAALRTDLQKREYDPERRKAFLEQETTFPPPSRFENH
ncbi:bifunctional precorrin-2 dehydrogenase/sirohydrochlorin ferrochelatase [Salipaludibacillus sp. CUR1]|uniref:precorrin-2 dehydrogenase/sirohydrochlorin ferrochelatase family protein n=1 Tax=Salipaludibacillus sp. CUR1 TaxID=2820003 RepID=UPI001E314AD2|nr:bifunctional precorrin-2 dehydrogenase/sirohydrochlorin ferrochelatase [Salipaludibacillus sp. CUR1]MCE7791138.1 bifunctional precorrin-2 dehydrogenase/sirohydrochlorin ferrochelatase [Salipaludibacillus sp. CUR1]